MLNIIKNTLYIGLMLIQHSVHADDQESKIERIQEAQEAREAQAERNQEAQELKAERYQEANEVYELGKMSMRSKDWRDAIEAFKEAGKHSRMKESAMYWQAYSHYQIKQNAQAKRLLERLIKNYPDSKWTDDAQVLLFEHGNGGEQSTNQAALDEELKLFTLQQIMFNKPEKALPKVYEMLEQSKSLRVKQNAIQLLGLSDSGQVADFLFRFIEKEKNQELQHQAIQMLSLRDNKNSRRKLKELYDNSKNREIKSAIIQGFIHHDDNQQLIALLKEEQDPELSKNLIQMLGIKGDSVALKGMYKSFQGEQRLAILEALALSGDADYLYYVIDNESDQEIRNQAIQSLIMVDADDMGEYLAQLYEKADNESEKNVISSVFIATDIDSSVILRILKKERSQERKQHLIHSLMAMGEVKALQELYQQESDEEIKSVIINQFGMMGATDVLIELYNDDPGIVNDQSFFQAFGMSSPNIDEGFLMARFKEGNEQVRQGVLQALLMQSNVDVMVKLLKIEKNHDAKKQIIQMIGITDPDALIDAIED